ncbi:hypothetical protein DM02DRAFT_659825 [Periconia macrospinosa]|uniref:Uncharacterized protein n=1 Tax=Periconia macrospinosa TaxID=97972 RepID=A0A2V1DDV2_9PLEO|nr:hypothetical protein DM02DRAFT_659825 [Periconia macrospinosa]
MDRRTNGRNTHFRFLDLPLECRHKVYRELLCTFDDDVGPRGIYDVRRARMKNYSGEWVRDKDEPENGPRTRFEELRTHRIETAILRTCKEIYREGTEFMFAVNQLIRVQTEHIFMPNLLLSSRIPVLMVQPDARKQVYRCVMVLTLTMVAPEDMWSDSNLIQKLRRKPDVRYDFMILQRDWDVFCMVLAEANDSNPLESTIPPSQGFPLFVGSSWFSNHIRVDLSLNATSSPGKHPSWSPTMNSFFTREVQQKLLKPFHTWLRNQKHVSIKGEVVCNLEKKVVSDVSGPCFSNAKEVVDFFQSTEANAHDTYQVNTSDYANWLPTYLDLRIDLQKVQCSAKKQFESLPDRLSYEERWDSVCHRVNTLVTRGVLACMEEPNQTPREIFSQGLFIIYTIHGNRCTFRSEDGGLCSIWRKSILTHQAFIAARAFKALKQLEHDSCPQYMTAEDPLRYIVSALEANPFDKELLKTKGKIRKMVEEYGTNVETSNIAQCIMTKDDSDNPTTRAVRVKIDRRSYR